MLFPNDLEILDIFRGGPRPCPEQYADDLLRLQREGYLLPGLLREETYEGTSEFAPGYTENIPVTWRLTKKGQDALAEAEERRNQVAKEAAKEARQRISDRAFQVFLVLLGGILALFSDHLPRIVHWVSSLFH